MIKAILFDLDGTLVDTHQANYLAYNKAINEYGFNITYDEFQKSIGHQANTFLPWFAPGLEASDYARIGARKAEFYKETVKSSVANIHLISQLQYLRKNHRTALVTTAKRQNALAVLRHHKLENSFDVIITAEDVRYSKPSPECYKLAIEKLNVDASEALAFEDSKPGVEAAEAAGIPVIMIKDF